MTTDNTYKGDLISGLLETVERQERKLEPRSEAEVDQLMRNQRWHYRPVSGSDWDEGGCEAERVERSSPIVPDRSE